MTWSIKFEHDPVGMLVTCEGCGYKGRVLGLDRELVEAVTHDCDARSVDIEACEPRLRHMVPQISTEKPE